MMHHMAHGLKSVALVFVLFVGAVYVIVHPINTVTLVYKIVMLFVGFADNLASGRYQ